MEHFSEQDIQIDRVWEGTEKGTHLTARHIPSGLKVDRTIGFELEQKHRQELIQELARLFLGQYPPKDFILERLNCGPQKGASLNLRHVPSGVTVSRQIGFESVDPQYREMVAELIKKLNERKSSESRF